MKISKKLWIILGSTVGGVAVAGGATVGVIANLPQNVFASSIVGVYEDFLDREEIAPIYNMMQKGSLSFSMSKMIEDDENYLEGQSYSGKMYFSADKGFAIQDLKIKNEDFKLDGNLYYDMNTLYIEESEILGGAYGITRNSAADDLDESIFAYGESKYSIGDQDLYEALLDALDATGDMKAKDQKNDLEKLSKKYTKQLWKIVSKNAEFESESKRMKLNGERKAVRVISMTIDSDAMADIVSDIYDFLSTDDDLIEYLEKNEAIFAPMYVHTEKGEPQSIVEAYEDFLEEFEENLDDICEEIEDSDEELVIEIATPKMSSKLLKLTVLEDDEKQFMIDFGTEGAKNTNKITLESYSYYYGEEWANTYIYEIKENSKKKYESVFEVNDEEIFAVKVDRVKDKYELSYGEMKLSGKISTKSKATTITLDKVVDEWSETTIKTDLTIVIDQSDKMPTMPKSYDRISDITEKDIEKWAEKLEDAVGSEDGYCDRCLFNAAPYYYNGKEYCYDCYWDVIYGDDGFWDIFG